MEVDLACLDTNDDRRRLAVDREAVAERRIGDQGCAAVNPYGFVNAGHHEQQSDFGIDESHDQKKEQGKGTGSAEKQPKIFNQVSREELYSSLNSGINNLHYYIAMVIAPLLGPNMALALATTLADKDLARVASKMGGIGVLPEHPPR